ncbi:MAG TPA: hypothetical protein VIR02_11105, partial [Anaerolineales bacterium]
MYIVRLQGFTGPQNLQVLNIQSQVTLESGNRQNKSPFAIALGDWFPLRTYFSTSKASPNDSEIVIVVIIVIGEAQLVLHMGGIIAQTAYLDRSHTAVRRTCKLDAILFGQTEKST